MLEHKGLYWSKLPGTEDAKCIEPSEDYILPLGKGRITLEADSNEKPKITIVTYGMGVYWSKTAAQNFDGQVEIVDLRTLVPIDKNIVKNSVAKTNRCLVVTEEPKMNSFAQSLSGWIQDECFTQLDAPVRVIGSENLPAIPLNETLEATMIPNANKVMTAIEDLLNY